MQHKGTQCATSITNQLTAAGNTSAIDLGESTQGEHAQAESVPEITLPKPNQTTNFRELPSTHALTPVNVDRSELKLLNFPDKQFVNQLCNDLREGTRIRYAGSRLPRLSKNLLPPTSDI